MRLAEFAPTTSAGVANGILSTNMMVCSRARSIFTFHLSTEFLRHRPTSSVSLLIMPHHLETPAQNPAQRVDTDSLSRRDFLKKSGGLAALATALGAPIPFADKLAPGLMPAALAQLAAGVEIAGKRGLRVLSDRPLNAETPVTLLDPEITATEHHFVRNNGHVPARATSRDLEGWNLVIDGEVESPLKLTLDAL